MNALREAAETALAFMEARECHHETTHRGGVIWTICDGCGKKWADDEGGFVGYREPEPITALRTALHTKPNAPTLIGWRTEDYLLETADRTKALSWQEHYRVMPIFEGDENTSIKPLPPKLSTTPNSIFGETRPPTEVLRWPAL